MTSLLPSGYGFARSTVYRQRAGVMSDHGTTAADWANPSEIPVELFSVQAAGGSEDNNHRTAGVGSRLLYAVGVPDVDYADRIRFGGPVPSPGDRVYQVEGEPEPWDQLGGMEFTIIRVTRRRG